MAAAGFGQHNFVRWEEPFVFSTGRRRRRSLPGMKERPTGIFAACDESAIGFIKTVEREAFGCRRMCP